MIEKVTLKEAEGALTKTNKLEYVRGLDKNGNPISINKEDLAAVLGELMPIENLRIAFNLKKTHIKPGAIFTIGAIAGLCVIRNGIYISGPSVVLIDNYAKTATHIAGVNYKDFCEFIFNGDNYNTIVSIKNIRTDHTGAFWIAYQQLGFNI